MSGDLDLIAKLRHLVAEVAELDDEAQITDDADLRTDLGINSMRGLEIMLLIEEDLGIAVPQQALYDVRTFGDVVRFVLEERGKAGAANESGD
jgi:acyl carrier protein